MKVPYEPGCPRCEGLAAEQAFRDNLNSMLEDMEVEDKATCEFFQTFKLSVEQMAAWLACDAEERCRRDEGTRCTWHMPSWVD